jgi:tRNA A37 threonylcarbamoyladenosine synthetase subunit TsaC/SUA5/YrdC
MKPRVYTDTSVLGGCEDDEFRGPSRRLLEAFLRGQLTLVLSELTLRELETAPERVRTIVGRVPEAHTCAQMPCT